LLEAKVKAYNKRSWTWVGPKIQTCRRVDGTVVRGIYIYFRIKSGIIGYRKHIINAAVNAKAMYSNL